MYKKKAHSEGKQNSLCIYINTCCTGRAGTLDVPSLLPSWRQCSFKGW